MSTMLRFSAGSRPKPSPLPETLERARRNAGRSPARQPLSLAGEFESAIPRTGHGGVPHRRAATGALSTTMHERLIASIDLFETDAKAFPFFAWPWSVRDN
ncbi:hypothetical protein GCM10010518_12800 [Kitasatospora cinereorecta]